MEYPTFITGDSSWFMPDGFYLPELVVEHEFGHQYWYGMVATNEFEDAWMDEGINSYTEVKVLDSILGKSTSIMNLAGATMGEREEQRLSYISGPDRDAIARRPTTITIPAPTAASPTARPPACCSRSRASSARTLWPRPCSIYFMKYRFTHPTKEDFLKTIRGSFRQGSAAGISTRQSTARR